MSIYFGNQKVSPLIVVPDNKLALLIGKKPFELKADELKNIDKISTYSFAYSLLTKIDIPTNIVTIEGSSFISCTKLEEIIIPSSIVFFGDYIFQDCRNLKKVTFLAQIKNLGRSTFNSCANLNLINIPNSVVRIAESTFSGCSSLRELTIPSSVTNIEYRALGIGSSTNKATITFLPTTPPTIQADTFTAEKIEKIIVPKGTAETYKAATNWSKFADYIVEADE